MGAGLISVAGPAAVTDLTYGGGRTQTAMGIVATVQSLASVLSFTVGAFLAEHISWPTAFGGLALFPLVAVGLLFVIHLRDEFPTAMGTPTLASGCWRRRVSGVTRKARGSPPPVPFQRAEAGSSEPLAPTPLDPVKGRAFEILN